MPLLTLAIFSALSSAYWFFLPTSLGGLAVTESFDEQQMGTIAAYYSMGYIVAALSSVFWIYYSYWRVRFSVILIGKAVSFTAIIFSTEYLEYCLTHIFAGFFSGALYSAVLSSVRGDLDASRKYAVVFFSQTIFALFCSITLPRIFLGYSMHVVAVYGTVALAICCAPLALWRSQQTAEESRVFARQMSYPSLPLVLAFISIAFFFGGYSGLYMFLESLGSDSGKGLPGYDIVAINIASGAIGSFGAYLLGGRLGLIWPMSLALVLSLISVIFFWPLKHDVATLVVASSLHGFAWNFGAPYRAALVAMQDYTGRFTALISAMQSVGDSAGPLLVGAAITFYGWRAALTVASLMWVIAFLSYLVSSNACVMKNVSDTCSATKTKRRSGIRPQL